MRMKKYLLYTLLLAVALTAGSCRRAVERVQRKIRLEAVEQIERQGVTGARVVVRVKNDSRYNLALSSAELGLYYGNACVGWIVLSEPVALARRTTKPIVTSWRLKISDPLSLYLLARSVKKGDYAQVGISCAVEGRGGPAPVKFSLEKMPLSEFLNTFGLTIQDVENYLK